MQSKSTKKKQETPKNKLIFVSSPYAPRGLWTKADNVELARKLCRAVVLFGHIPIAPHLIYPQFLNDDNQVERDMGMMASLSLIPLCDELWYYSDRGISKGMEAELQKAGKELIPCIEWKKELYPHLIDFENV